VPTIYDLHGLARCTWLRRKKKVMEKVERLVVFILSPTYQSFPESFGNVIELDRKSYYAHGWKVEFEPAKGLRPRSQLLVLESLAQFESAWKSKMFIKEVEWMDGFRGDDGIWRFPKEYLTEGKGYWVAGGRMALADPPRTKEKLAMESTLRALVVHFGEGRK
jgi:hypothetical protein